jgi:sugar/nucleoside kinase (ribokinase family)
MLGIALLGGRPVYTGKVGCDEHGGFFKRGLASRGVKVNVAEGEGTTGISLILITPDRQRTMCTYLGMSRRLSWQDIAAEDIRRSRYLYVTGYMWDTDTQKEAVLYAMSEANRHGVSVALNLSDSFCVERHKPDFLRLLREHVDIVVGNDQEAQALTDTATPREALAALCEMCDTAVVTMDCRGSLISTKGQVWDIPVCKTCAVDTTGAGDMYAAGLLFGLTRGLSIEATGRLASYVAAKVVASLGPRLDTLDSGEVDALTAV